jgi:hypothetical protein
MVTAGARLISGRLPNLDRGGAGSGGLVQAPVLPVRGRRHRLVALTATVSATVGRDTCRELIR